MSAVIIVIVGEATTKARNVVGKIDSLVEIVPKIIESLTRIIRSFMGCFVLREVASYRISFFDQTQAQRLWPAYPPKVGFRTV